MSATTTRTVTRQVKIEVPTFTPCGGEPLPLVSSTRMSLALVKNMLEAAVHTLITNWDGDAERVFVNLKPEFMDVGYFEPNDKGSLSVFGLNKDGTIIFGMCRYEGDKRATTELEREDHYFIKATNKASRYS